MTQQARSGPQPARVPIELALVWILPLLVAGEILVTYARLPPHQLYHVSGNGLAGGAGRVLVFTNFPLALIALAVVALLAERVPGWRLRALSLAAAGLCCAVFWPGVVTQTNLDARTVNTLAAAGLALVFALTLTLARRHGLTRASRQRGDPTRIAFTFALLVLAAPWIAADLGFYLTGVPLLGQLFETGPPRLPARSIAIPVVHHGHHHGMDGVLLAVSALLLARALTSVRGLLLRRALTVYLSLMLCYGLANAVNDLWTEQVVKRGWTTWQIPNVLEPSLTIAWTIIAAAVLVLALLAGRHQAHLADRVGEEPVRAATVEG